MLSTKEILTKYLEFYKSRDHHQIPNVSLVPENDSTLLFVNSGMFPLVPYLSGEKHAVGKRLVNVQRALRLEDIEEVGDNKHTLGFHMIGNWSLGDYFKKEQLPWVYEFLIEHLGLDINKVVATVFVGDQYAPKDDESISILKGIFEKYGADLAEGKNVFAFGKKENWWQRGDAIGELGGPDSEIHYYLGEGDFVSQGKNPVDNETEFLEIGNSVFMQYKKTEAGWEELSQKNVDFGGGLERLAWVVQGKKDLFETDNFWSIIQKIQELSGKSYYENDLIKKSMRIVSDHIKVCVLLAMDGVEPSNKDQGYILRRLLRRMIRSGRRLGIKKDLSVNLVSSVVTTFSWLYPVLEEKKTLIEDMFKEEETKFSRTLEEGQRQIGKILSKKPNYDLSGWAKIAFDLYQSVGYPQEMCLEDLKENNIAIFDKDFLKEFDSLVESHQAQSRSGAQGKFTGGLADHSDIVIKYHTVTHLLNAGLQKVLGTHVSQAGSNITNERARFDFFHEDKLSDQQVIEVEKFVNDRIAEKLPVTYEVMDKEQALTKGVSFIKNETYPDKVKVYFVGSSFENAISKEFCGGPHVENTGDLSPISLYKQENIGKGKKRVYVKFK